MPSPHPSDLIFAMTFLLLTAPLLCPHLTVDPWAAFIRKLEQLRRDRLVKKSALIEQRMKKYWVIDMRKLR